MTAFELDLTVTKGVTYGPVQFTMRDEDGDPIDFTDGGEWKVLAYARPSKDSQFKIDLAPTFTDAAGGQFQIAFTDEQTLGQLAGRYHWDMIFESPAGERSGPYFAGKYIVQEIYTHN